MSNLVYSYSGQISDEVLGELYSDLKSSLKNKINNVTIESSVYRIFDELISNVKKYYFKKSLFRSSDFSVYIEELPTKVIAISCENKITKEDFISFENSLNLIENLSDAELKKVYKNGIKSHSNAADEGGLGLLIIYKKVKKIKATFKEDSSSVLLEMSV